MLSAVIGFSILKAGVTDLLLCTVVLCSVIAYRRVLRGITSKVWKWFIKLKNCCLNCLTR